MNITTEKMKIVYDETILSENMIIQTVVDAGYGVIIQTRNDTFEIEGMTCTSCAQKIENAINKLPGIVTVVVNFATEKMYVEYQYLEVDIETIIQTVKQLGYNANIESNNHIKTSEISDKRQKYIESLWRRFIWSAIFAFPLLYIAMGPMLPFGGLPLPQFLDPVDHSFTFSLVQLLLILPVLYLGRSFYRVGFQSLFKGYPNMDSLISIGTTSAVLQGIVMTYLLMVGIVDIHHGHPELYFESAVVILVLITLGKYLEAIPGHGISVIVGQIEVLMGNEKLMLENQIEIHAVQAVVHRLASEGKTPMYVAADGIFVGIIAVADTIKANSIDAIKKLHQMGVQVVMITGDNTRTAQAIAKQVGIDRVLSEVLPEDKATEVKRLQAEGLHVAMVGDGINDAPALAQANIGIAIASGTDIVIESADIVLMRSDLMAVPTAIELSRATMKNIKQNLFWAFAYNIIGIPVAMGILYVFGGPLLNPMLAGAAMSLSSVSVLLNALRLKKFKPFKR